MARKSKREVLADRQDETQRPLFDQTQLPAELPALESIRARRYECTGARLVDDDLKALKLVELICLRWGVKKISRAMNISQHTVRAARRLLEAQGKLAPYVQRVTEQMEDVIETGLEVYHEALLAGKVPPGQIMVGVGITFDKRQVTKGEPTTIRGSVDQTEERTVEAINAYLERMPGVNVSEVRTVEASVDLRSTDESPKPLQLQPYSDSDTTLATTSTPETVITEPSVHPSIHPDGRTDDATDHHPERDPGEGGGGVGGGFPAAQLDPLD